MTPTRTKLTVVEVHEWPERACPGPHVQVWSGTNRKQAEKVRDELEARRLANGNRFYYEVRETA